MQTLVAILYSQARRLLSGFRLEREFQARVSASWVASSASSLEASMR